jgi:hypothetical protein
MNIMSNFSFSHLSQADFERFFQDGLDSGCWIFVEAKQKADEALKRLDELSAEFPGFDRIAWLKNMVAENEKQDMMKWKRGYDDDDITTQNIKRALLASKSLPVNNL